jgi:nitrogen regulatory protein P-II 1
MYLLYCILEQTENLKAVMKVFLECGIPGATVITTTGMGKIISDSPSFQHLRQMVTNERPYNYTIMALVNDETVVDKLAKRLEGIVGDLNKRKTGILFTVPVNKIFGFKDHETE